jgi:hypothetical protein
VKKNIEPALPPDRWSIANGGIEWNVLGDRRQPHEDHVEMSGLKTSSIVR